MDAQSRCQHCQGNDMPRHFLRYTGVFQSAMAREEGSVGLCSSLMSDALADVILNSFNNDQVDSRHMPCRTSLGVLTFSFSCIKALSSPCRPRP